MAIENAAANSNNTVSNLTRNNYNKENDVIELKDQQQERFITSSSSPHHQIIKPMPLDFKLIQDLYGTSDSSLI